MKKRLYRNKKNGVVFGVCEGIGDYLNIDPVLIRIAYALKKREEKARALQLLKIFKEMQLN